MVIGRRQFISALAGTVVAWPLAARAQHLTTPVIGMLSAGSFGNPRTFAFREGLKETGYVEGQNTIIEFRGANGRYELMAAMAADLVGRRVKVIAVDSTEGTRAAKDATETIPIVFVLGSDPVKAGLVASLNRPGGNLTGVAALTHALDAKRLEMIRETVPAAKMIGVLFNPKNADADQQLQDIKEAAQSLGEQIRILNASTKSDINEAFKTFAQLRGDALIVNSDNFLNDQSEQIAALTFSFAIPTIAARRVFAASGVLMSYGPDILDAVRQQGIYVGRILKGEKVGELPVLQPTKFELVVNQRTAKTLGITMPPTLLATADEVIE
jgi:putative tryptophan/tyrosine transport system substrate-binding protein